MKNRFYESLIGVVALLFVYASCATTEGALSELDGEWEVLSVSLDSVVVDIDDLSADIDPYFGFDVSKDRFYGNTAYNAVSGNLSADSLDSGRLAIYHIASRMVASPTMNLEQSMMDNLEKVKRYETFGTEADTLEFYDANGVRLFKLARRAPYSLLMGKWQFVKVKGKNIDPMAADKVPYVIFDISHNVKMIFGDTGCNAFNGRVRLEVGNQKIHFGDISVSTRICDEIAWENDLLTSLEEAETYETVDNQIRVFNANGDEIIRLQKLQQ